MENTFLNTNDIGLDLITVLGPTASGKTEFAAQLAYKIDAEIISGDSRQIYRRMNIGTGKDLEEYTVKDKTIAYHLIDIAEPGYKYNLFEYQQDFLQAYQSIKEKNKIPVLCGGTGLYIESVLKGYRLFPVPENPTLRRSLENKTLQELADMLKGYKTLHNTTDIDTAKRAIRAIEIEEYYQNEAISRREFPKIKSLIIGINIDREERREKITCRLKTRLKEGMVEEVKAILDSGLSPDDLIYYGLEYKYLTNYILGKLSYEQMFSELETAIHQFAKRQMTWFRGMERKGFLIHWIDASLPLSEKIEKVLSLIEKI